jgi:hypothetical protein
VFISIANGYVMPLKELLLEISIQKLDAVHSTETSLGYRQNVCGDNRLQNTGLTRYGHLMYGSVAVCGDKCMKIQ